MLTCDNSMSKRMQKVQ